MAKRIKKLDGKRKSFHVKKGDEVVVISGAHRGKRGKIETVLAAKERVIIEGVSMVKRAVRKSPKHPEGGIIEKEGTISISNVMLLSDYEKSRAVAGKKGN